jgi:hypothetical protein
MPRMAKSEGTARRPHWGKKPRVLSSRQGPPEYLKIWQFAAAVMQAESSYQGLQRRASLSSSKETKEQADYSGS